MNPHVQALARSGCQLNTTWSSVDMRALEVMPGREARVVAVVSEKGVYVTSTPTAPTSGRSVRGAGAESALAQKHSRQGSSTATAAVEAFDVSSMVPGLLLSSTRTLELELKYDAKAQVWKVHQVVDMGAA